MRWKLYRLVMKIAHKYHWHYAPKIGPLLPDGEFQLWCKWCGFRQTLAKEVKTLSPPPKEPMKTDL